MTLNSRKEPTFLLAGDVFILYISLWFALFVRHGEAPSDTILSLHLAPFSILFLVWIASFFIAGLYEKHTLVLKSKLPVRIFNAQFTNALIAVLFFYLIPYFEITPKINLFIYLIVSSVLLSTWRLYGHNIFGFGKKQSGVLVGSGEEMHELWEEVNKNPKYGLRFISGLDLSKIDEVDFKDEIVKLIYSNDINIIVIDIKDSKVEPVLSHLYNLIFSHVRFLDMHKVYEDIFDRVPLSLVRESWFLENISSTSKATYDFLKRAMDIVIALPLAILSLLVYPFVALAIKVEDGGSIFYKSKRTGKNNVPVDIIKFRTMVNKDSGYEVLKSSNTETRVGRFLRKSRIDELPQLWDVVQGDLSLIGPRPEIPELVEQYEVGVPYYNIRHLIKPGLSGWGQINDFDVPRKGTDVKKTRRKLSYDLYYIKNRSFMLDLKIALKTVGTLISRTGS